MNNPMYFEIQADDVQRAVKFYETIFGWKMEKQENLPVEYYRVETTGIAGGILKRPVAQPSPGGTNAAVISMEVENFDDTAAKILSIGGVEALPKFAVPGRCWQGYFIDTEGNTFGIFEVDESAA